MLRRSDILVDYMNNTRVYNDIFRGDLRIVDVEIIPLPSDDKSSTLKTVDLGHVLLKVVGIKSLALNDVIPKIVLAGANNTQT
jgi:hypothetical protein